MLFVSIALAAAAVLLYFLAPEYQIYTTYPWPVYGLLALGIAAGWWSRARRWLRLPVLGLVVAAAVLFTIYTISLSHLGSGALAVQPGDPLPNFTLPTSQGETFSSADLRGSSAALYIFYRGDW